ncbi:MAG: DUF447 family protein [Planctomycetales bacterium]
MILEGVVTTLTASGELNVAPMGPVVDASMETLLLRPFHTSVTHANLSRSRQGVLHVTDDVELIARAAMGKPDPPPKTFPATAIEGRILEDACRWYAFRVREVDDSEPRSRMTAEVVDRGRLRDFFGFNRAKHAVLEAAVLATRVHMLDAGFLRDEFARLKVIVDKTSSPRESAAFDFLRDRVAERMETPSE